MSTAYALSDVFGLAADLLGETGIITEVSRYVELQSTRNVK